LFRLIQSNSIETLAAALAEQLLENTPEDPFAVQKVLVSTNAMGRWLERAGFD
jgi:exonuclease V gamma subunit